MRSAIDTKELTVTFFVAMFCATLFMGNMFFVILPVALGGGLDVGCEGLLEFIC